MTKHNSLSISIISLLFVLLFTPLLVTTGLYFPYVTGKVFVFRAIVSISLILWTILVLKKPEFLPKKNSVLIASGVFVLWLALSNFLGVDRANSFFSNFERMEGWFTHVYLFVYLVIISTVFTTEKIWNWFLGISVALANIVAFFVMFDSTDRTTVFLGNSSYVAVYILFNLYFALLLWYRTFKSNIKDTLLRYSVYVYFVSSILLCAYIIFRTQTRGTVLALFFSGLLLLVLSAISFWKNKKVRIVAISTLSVMVLGAGIFWMNRDAKIIQENPLLVRIATISASEGTGKARLENWKTAVQGVKENPVFGWGQENFTYVFASKYNPQMYGQEPWFDRTHNVFLDWGTQSGLGGLAIYLSLFGFALYVLYKKTSFSIVEKHILTSLLFGYFIHNLFVFDNYSSYLLFFTTLGLIVYGDKEESFNISLDEKLKQICAIGIIVTTIIVGYLVIIKPYQVASGIIKIMTIQDGNEVLDMYKKLIDKNTFGTFEVGTRLMGDVTQFIQVPDEAFVQKYFTYAGQVGKDLVDAAPQNVRALEFYGTFLLRIGDTQQAIEYLERAREIAPNRQNNLYTLGFAYVSKQEYSKAVEIFKHAYEVAPENNKAKNYYGAALLLNGDLQGKELIKDYSYQDPFFLSVFNKTKQYKESIKIIEQQLKDTPMNHQLRVSLAITYLFDGNRTKAIELLRQVIKDVPEFKEQGTYLIQEIQAGRNPVK